MKFSREESSISSKSYGRRYAERDRLFTGEVSRYLRKLDHEADELKSVESRVDEIRCNFRTDVRQRDGRELADCQLLASLLRTNAFEVERDACVACQRSPVGTSLLTNPVLASLAIGASERLRGDPEHISTIRDQAENALLAHQTNSMWAGGWLAACDVVLCCETDNCDVRRSMDSILNQEGAVPILHLVNCSGGEAGELFEQYKTLWNVRIHDLAENRPLAAAHSLIEKLETPFLAVQTADCISRPNRIALAIDALYEHGAEIFGGAAVVDGGAHLQAQLPNDSCYDRFFPSATIVMRVATFVDMGGAADRVDEVEEIIYRAACEDRQFIVSDDPIVTLSREPQIELGPKPEYAPAAPYGRGLLRTHARGFTPVRAECDVVVPFHGELDFTRAAIESILAQENSECVIHLVDDCSQADDFMAYWKSHRQVRAYRNRSNIGQYSSFNNVSPFFETGLAAVQDADDISLPHRIQAGAAMLHYCNADFFGGAVELFGSDKRRKPIFVPGTTESVTRSDYSWSRYPLRTSSEYFLQNPTAMFTVEMFREKNGYTDFGDPLANRASLDSEFLLRCLHSGVHFAISRDVVTKYRVHDASSTQNSSTGWGTPARTKAVREVRQRNETYRRVKFNPQLFGAIGKYQDQTIRL